MDPGELSVFYKPRADMEEYDATYRVWAHKEAEDGVYTFTLPRGCAVWFTAGPRHLQRHAIPAEERHHQ